MKRELGLLAFALFWAIIVLLAATNAIVIMAAAIKYLLS